MKAPRVPPPKEHRTKRTLRLAGYVVLSRPTAQRLRAIALTDVCHTTREEAAVLCERRVGLVRNHQAWYLPEDVHFAYGFVRECFAGAEHGAGLAAVAVHRDPARVDVLVAVWQLALVTRPVFDTRPARQALADLLDAWRE